MERIIILSLIFGYLYAGPTSTAGGFSCASVKDDFRKNKPDDCGWGG